MRRDFLLFLVTILCLPICYAKAPRTRSNNGLVIATWNIGHFSNGKKDYSLISLDAYKSMSEQYKSFIYDSIKADILCLNEYDNVFLRDGGSGDGIKTDEILFADFKNKAIFKKNRFVCNAIVSNVKTRKAKMHRFAYSDSAKINRPSISWHYYVESDIKIAGKVVKLICTHLVNRSERYCQDQIMQLIRKYENANYVIICGDMNTWNFSQFVKTGYKLANDGRTVTFPSKGYALDNIIVKGLNLSNVRVLKTELSDHYPLICEVSL
jgi:endonuclease/exonuclease/phosphatase family metal-dependent hydrolase